MSGNVFDVNPLSAWSPLSAERNGGHNKSFDSGHGSRCDGHFIRRTAAIRACALVHRAMELLTMFLLPDLASQVKNRLKTPGVKDFASFLLKLTQYTLNRAGLQTQSDALSYLTGNRLFEERKAHIAHFVKLSRAQRRRESLHDPSGKIDCCVLGLF